MKPPPLRLAHTSDGEAVPPPPFSTEDCAREPIHIPGSIQPHGALVAFDGMTGGIRYASDNLADWLPVGTLPLKGRSLSDLLDARSWQSVQQSTRGPSLSASRHQILKLRGQSQANEGPALQGSVHRHRGQYILEIEAAETETVDWMQSYTDLMDGLRDSQDLEELCTRACSLSRRLLGFDRVMLYRFHPDWHGEVLAESRETDMEPFLGLHYPASDIPAQARDLYRTSLIRYIADVNYEPCPVSPYLDPLTGEPLDMSHAVLRSVSPVHLQYLRNMGVRSTLTMSIVLDGQLWGLLAAHHRSPTRLPLRMRQTAQALSLGASYQVGWHLQQQRLREAQEASQVQQRIMRLFNQAEVSLADVMEHAGTSLLRLTGATGGALWQGDTVVPFGAWPARESSADLLAEARQQLATSGEDLVCSDALTLVDAWEPDEARRVRGMMVLALGDFAESGLLWFRPEHRDEVSWGGDPAKPVSVGRDERGLPVLAPRASFERWAVEVKGRSRPWSDADRMAARQMAPLRQLLALRASLQSVRESDQRFRALLSLQSDAYWQVDGQGRIVTLSKPLPLELAAVEGQRWQTLLAPWAEPECVAALDVALSQPRSFRDLRVTFPARGSRPSLDILFSGEPLRNDVDRVIGFHGTVTDITAELRLEQEARRREAAELSNQAKSRFLSHVSHELRTPLNAVLGNTQLLLNDPTTTSVFRTRLLTIEKAAQWLTSMIGDLLEIGRIEAGMLQLDLRRLDLNERIGVAVDALRSEADASRIRMIFTTTVRPLWITADSLRLSQVLTNLLSNAVKYNHPGGTVDISATLDESTGTARVLVSDSGMGMSPEQVAQLFQPFNRLGREGQQTPGTGLGLVIAKQLIEGMGGRISVRSRVGVGSEFAITLHAAETVENTNDVPAPSIDEINGGLSPAPLDTRLLPGRAIYVEDEDVNFEVLSCMFSTVGEVPLLRAKSARTALEIIRAERPALALIDLNLEGPENGTWLLSQIREDATLGGLRCVLVTADAMPEGRLPPDALGFDLRWVKPLDLMPTVRTLRALLSALNEGLPGDWRVRFDSPDAQQLLDRARDGWLDTLDFGVIRLDPAGRATAYNLRESLFTGFDPRAVVGRNFFEEVGLCMNNPLISGRVMGPGPTDMTLDHAFRLHMKTRAVRLRLLGSPQSLHRYVLVQSGR